MKRKPSHDHEEFVAAADTEHLCLFRRDAGSGYQVTCPGLPPMIAFGDTIDEARANAREEIEGWIEEHDRTRAWISAVQPEWW